ncbi:esterase, PHB depolymerase family (plasmid) [Marinibacterium anthonyi]|nr:esterase, PHB depolymerase family [Marinibacterium anthonyi]
MPTRRTFLIGATCAGALVSFSAPVFAQGITAESATAITRVYGDGLRFVAVAVRYSAPIMASDLSAGDFAVDGRTVTAAYPATSTDPADRAEQGNVVIVELSADDADASLAVKSEKEGGPQGDGDGSDEGGPANDGPGNGPGGGGPGNAGTVMDAGSNWAEPSAAVVQAELTLPDGTLPATEIETSEVRNLVVDDFQQFVWNDPETGDTLPYNLFVPKDYDPAQSYPLVNFMHDAGATGPNVLTTLKQGLGAISWASQEDQAKTPSFVLAPQFDQIIADDNSDTSSMLDTTINLIKALTEQYSIDQTRLYTTGQSGGGMMSIAMNIKYPEFFAASFLVACQWDPALVAPMAGNRLFILVSQDDSKAFPGQNAITEALEAEGATVARAVWDGNWSDEQFRFAFDDLNAAGARINYVTFDEGSVFLPGADTAGASGHRNTWRIAYSIAPIRAWLLRND